MRFGGYVVAAVVTVLTLSCGRDDRRASIDALSTQVTDLQRQLAATPVAAATLAPTVTPMTIVPTEVPRPTPVSQVATPVARPVAPTSVSCTYNAAVQAVTRSTVQVITQGGYGSAFYLGDGQFATAAHVIEGQTEIILRVDGGDSSPATVIGVDFGTDVALLRANLRPPPIQWGNALILKIGDEVGVSGFEEGDPHLTPHRGSVTGILTARGITYVQTDAAINHGDSGGPLFDNCGRVVGLVKARFEDPLAGIQQRQGIGYAIAVESVKPALPAALSHPLILCDEETYTIAAREAGTVTISGTSAGGTLWLSYSVQQGTIRPLGINFRLASAVPEAVALVSDQDQPGMTYRLPLTAGGDYLVSLNNQHSSFTKKVVTLRICLYR